jgi:hypothetical protein
VNLKELKDMRISDLLELAKNLNIEGARGMRKQELIFAILQAQTEQNGSIYGEGVLQVLPRASASSGPRTPPTCPGPTTSTCPPPRSVASTCGPATR